MLICVFGKHISLICLPGSTRSSASVPVLVLLGLSARQRYVAESIGWTRLTCNEPDGNTATRESGSQVSSRSSRFFCQRMIGIGSPETSQRSRAVSPRYEDTDSVGTTTFSGPKEEKQQYFCKLLSEINFSVDLQQDFPTRSFLLSN